MDPLNQNQFLQVPVLGQLDLRFNPDVISAEIDASQVGVVLPGQSVKLVNSTAGIPKVVAVSSDSDIVYGFVNYDMKTQSYVALDKIEVSTMYGNVMYLKATAAIPRGSLVKGVAATVGGIAIASPASGPNLIGWAYDRAIASGDLIRVVINTPSFNVAASLASKAGVIAGASFAGTPKKFSVVFSSAYPSSAYAIAISGTDGREYTYESKTSAGFTINANADTAIAGQVSWMTIASGEST